MENFLQKNEKQLEELFQYVENNRDKILNIYTSPELFEYIKSSQHMLNSTFNGIRIVRDEWATANKVRFVMKEHFIKFNLPCMCGIYDDEIHP